MPRRLVVVMILLPGLVNVAPAWENGDIGAVSASGNVGLECPGNVGDLSRNCVDSAGINMVESRKDL